MKKLALCLVSAVGTFVTDLQAQQWSGNNDTSGKIYRTGRVGISSQSNQTVNTPSNFYIWQRDQPTLLQINSSGHIADPYDPSKERDNSSFLRLGEDDSGFRGGYIEYNNHTNKLHIGTHNAPRSLDLRNDVPAITIHRGSKGVGVGTTSPAAGYALTVDGSILMEEAKVQVVEGADFVFDDDYDLPSLESIEQHVKTHKHLPDVPSAQRMREEGMMLGEMNILLLQKIEELTLHMIQQHKKIADQQSALDRLNNEIIKLRGNK